MDREEQDIHYGLDPRADTRMIWGRFIEEKELVPDAALLDRAAWLRVGLPASTFGTVS